MQSKRDMFNRFSENLEAVKSHPKINLEPDVSDVVACPQCFLMIEKSDLIVQPSPFTFEHVPPKSMGGKVCTFTCRQCNSWSGHHLESHLAHALQLADFIEGVPGAKADASVTFGDTTSVTASLQYTEQDVLQIIADHSRSRPGSIERSLEMLNDNPPIINLRTSGQRGQGHRIRRPEAALLRIAYMKLFSIFGYGFLVNPGSQAIRSQFKKPEDEILPSMGIFADPSLPDDALGVHVINSPPELRCFMVAFDLDSGVRPRRFAVLVPGPTAPSTQIYEHLSSDDQQHSRLTVRAAPVDLEYDDFLDPDDAFAFHEIWKQAAEDLPA